MAANETKTYVGGSSTKRSSSGTAATQPTTSETVSVHMVEQMIATSEARTDTKLVELRGHVDLIKSDLTGQMSSLQGALQSDLARKPGTGILIGTILGVGALIVGIMAFGGDRFDGGVQVTSISVQQAQEARELATENAKQIENLLGILAERVSQSATEAPLSPPSTEVETQP